jgi:hypothetical protein
MLHIDTDKLECNSTEFAQGLEREGIGGAQAGYPFYPTDQPWYRDSVVYGASGMPWSLAGDGTQSTEPRIVELPNAHESNRTIVRVDVHEALGANEARDLVAAVAKLARYFAIESASAALSQPAMQPAAPLVPPPVSPPMPQPMPQPASASARIAAPALSVPVAQSQETG